MRVSRKLNCLGIAVLVAVTALAALAGPAHAKTSEFGMEYLMNLRANNFQALDYLVKQNKEKIPSEIDSLAGDALSPGKSFDERMYLLSIAKSMASLYKHWHGEGKYLLRLETIELVEIERARKEEEDAARWSEVEGAPGYMLMKEHAAQMEDKGLEAVAFPHQIHRTLFACNACHEERLVSTRGANNITHASGQCRACHDGKAAFADNVDCERCHTGKPRTEKPAGTPQKAPEPAGGPIEIRDNTIVFETKEAGIAPAHFSHAAHTKVMACATCHPRAFKDALGANRMTKEKMARGEFCGKCHAGASNRGVSFPLFDCEACHGAPRDASPNTIMRKAVGPDAR